MAVSALSLNQEGLPPVQSRVVHVAGLVVTVYGLDSIPSGAATISVLWLLHGSTQSQKSMSPVAARCIHNWYQHRKKHQNTGLIAVTFDQRNHGTRLIERKCNTTWLDGNGNHAQDMFSIINGTVLDLSLLIDHLPSFILREPESPRLRQHMVLGFSLGGHAVWQALFHDCRITAGVSVTGCPDYMELMKTRARQWNLDAYTSSDGTDFLESPSFPARLVETVMKWDPKAQLFGTTDVKLPSSEEEQQRLISILKDRLKDKRIIAFYGANDELVPHSSSQPMLEFLKNTAHSLDPYPLGKFSLKDTIFSDTGHLFTKDMLQKAMIFIYEQLAEASDHE